ncbi:hypothetical protein L2E82_16978 [Cichorium intybus]|uniref:Uncharacterized protein n=1 Tax=Cichorium intybus TaxID=13427 RepID=A0ACB9F6H5_CICIN|nr:hypothetical protein L2E82_16978 [Cichorium intybus]
MTSGKPHTNGLHQFDIKTGKVVTEWKFAKDGTDITMRDVTNDSKGAQMDPSGSTFLGLDDNRLCRCQMGHALARHVVHVIKVRTVSSAQNPSRSKVFAIFVIIFIAIDVVFFFNPLPTTPPS